jgi:hypothetical protein
MAVRDVPMQSALWESSSTRREQREQCATDRPAHPIISVRNAAVAKRNCVAELHVATKRKLERLAGEK